MKLSILLISTFWVAATIGALGMDGPPKAPVHETEDEHFGTKIKDPYRWMENIKQDPEVQQWLKAQADFTKLTRSKLNCAGGNRWIGSRVGHTFTTSCRAIYEWPFT
jgi:hypothetical protein